MERLIYKQNNNLNSFTCLRFEVKLSKPIRNGCPVSSFYSIVIPFHSSTRHSIYAMESTLPKKPEITDYHSESWPKRVGFWGLDHNQTQKLHIKGIKIPKGWSLSQTLTLSFSTATYNAFTITMSDAQSTCKQSVCTTSLSDFDKNQWRLTWQRSLPPDC